MAHPDITSLLAIGTAAILAGMAQMAFAGGFQVPTQSARAAGEGDAFTAQADDPSAIYYNPAGLTQLDGTQLSAGVYAVYTGFEFHGDNGIGDASSNEPAYLPHAYLASDLGQKRWRFGLGVNTAFGLKEDWGDDSPLRNDVTNTDLSVMNIAPAVSYQLTDQFSLGAAFNLYYGRLELNNKLPLPTGTEGDFHLEGDGYGAGGTFGSLWKISDQHAVGLVYRSPFQITFDGSSRIEQSAAPEIGPSDTSETVDFPQILVLGYAYRPTDRLTLEADLQWADWHTVKDVAIESDDPRFASLPPRRFEYESSFTYRLGAEYRLNSTWALRAGYIYSPTSSPGKTFTPAVVDLDSHILTLGVGYQQPTWGVDLAYRLIIGVGRDVTNSVNSPPGEYSDLTQAIVLTITLKS